MAGRNQALVNANFSRYTSVVFVVGQEVMCQALDWLYHHHHRHEPDLSVGDCFRRVRGTKIMKFEKTVLDRCEDPANMDIPLLYRLLQHTCGLAPETPEFAWNKPPLQADEQCLEHWLYQIKAVRHGLCHNPAEFMHMTDAEFNTHLQELKCLLFKSVQEAGRRSGMPDTRVNATLDQINDKLTAIQTSMPQSAILPQEFALVAKEELKEKWQQQQLSPPLLRWAEETQEEVALSQLLRDLVGEEPQVVVVGGETGVGKTSLCRQVLQAWLEADPQMPEVMALDVVVLVECRRVFTRDVTRLLVEELLPQTCRRCHPEEVQGLLGSLRVLWLVDGFEEATADAQSLVSRLVERCSAGHVVLLTGQQDYLADMTTTLSKVKAKVHQVTHCGLTHQGFRALLASLLQEPSGDGSGKPEWGERCTAFTEEVKALSPALLGDLHNPLKLILVVGLWKEGRLGEATGPSMTHLYAAIQDALVAKLVAKLRAKSSLLTKDEAGRRVRLWVEALCGEALAMWARFCFVNLDQEAEQHLRERAMDLLLPYTDCFSTFLGCQARPGPQHSFLHHTQQSVMAAQHLCTLLRNGQSAEQVQCVLLSGQTKDTNMDHFQAVLIQAAISLAAEGHLDEERARAVARLLEQCHFRQWLDLVRRTRCCLPLAHQVHAHLKGTWLVEERTVQAANTLVGIGAPDTIIIWLTHDHRNNSDLLLLLQSLNKTSVEVTLTASHSGQNSIQCGETLYSDDNLLQPLCGPASTCHLVEFQGLVTGDGCRALYHHRHTLRYMSVGVLDHTALDTVIQLTHQAQLHNEIDLLLFCSLEGVPKESVSRRVELNLFVSKVNDGEAEKAVALIRRISHNFNNITLGRVTPSTVCSMMKAFGKPQVRAHSVGRFANVKPFGRNQSLTHIHFFPLPPPPEMNKRTIYKMWNNPHVQCKMEINMDELSLSFSASTKGNPHTGVGQHLNQQS